MTTTTKLLWVALAISVAVVITVIFWSLQDDDSPASIGYNFVTEDQDPRPCFKPEQGMSLEDFTAALGEPDSSSEIITATSTDPEVPATEYYWGDNSAIFIDGKADFWVFVGHPNVC